MEPRVLATPEMVLNIDGEIEDDFGVSDISIFKSLIGYRDRGEVVQQNLDRKEYEYAEKIALAEIGVKPGQKLAFYLEARDYNPSRLGVTSSDPVLVEIISEDNYAQILRDRAALKQFSKRYRVLENELKKAKDSLDKLKEAIKSGDEKQIAEMSKQAKESHEQVSSLLEQIANDFQAFDMEGNLKKIADESVGKLQQNMSEMQQKQNNLTAGDVDEMLERLGETQLKARALKEDAKKMDKVAEVLKMAAQFQKLYKNQQSIVERMGVLAKEMANGDTRNVVQLESLGRLQEKNKKALEKFAVDLKKAANGLPEEFAEMRQSSLDFIDKMEELKIPSPMGSAAQSAEDGRSRDALNNAYLAQQLMKQLMEESEGFG